MYLYSQVDPEGGGVSYTEAANLLPDILLHIFSLRAQQNMVCVSNVLTLNQYIKSAIKLHISHISLRNIELDPHDKQSEKVLLEYWVPYNLLLSLIPHRVYSIVTV